MLGVWLVIEKHLIYRYPTRFHIRFKLVELPAVCTRRWVAFCYFSSQVNSLQTTQTTDNLNLYPAYQIASHQNQPKWSDPIPYTNQPKLTNTLHHQSKDSSATNLHMHHPRLADFFEDFTRPHTSPMNPPSLSSATGTATTHYNAQTHSTTVTYGNSSSSPTTTPSFLPVEDIYVLPQFQPPNPEDEDDVVPDQHAAFGITRAMERRRGAVWRDLGMEEVVSGEILGGGSGGSGGMADRRGAGGSGVVSAGRRTFRGIRVKDSGRLMGGRRVTCLR